MNTTQENCNYPTKDIILILSVVFHFLNPILVSVAWFLKHISSSECLNSKVQVRRSEIHTKPILSKASPNIKNIIHDNIEQIEIPT